MRSQSEANNLVNKRCEELNYRCSEFKYIGTDKTMLPLTCNNGHSWCTTSFDSFVNRNTRCNHCNVKTKCSQESSYKIVKKHCDELNYKFKDFVFTNVDDTKIEITCDKNHKWIVSYYNFTHSKKKCATCNKINANTRKLSNEVVFEKVDAICKDKKFTYEPFTYTTALKTIINLKCEFGHEWSTKYNTLINSGCGCPDCGGSKRKTQQSVVNNILNHCKTKNWTFNNEKDFVYSNVYSRLSITCNCGHSWNPTYQSFSLIGSGCPKCAGCAKLTQEEAFQKVNTVCENKKFSFKDFKYIGNKDTVVNITCENGHEFEIGFNHLVSHQYGCAVCSGQVIAQEDAEKKVKTICQIYGYSYETFTYKNHNTKLVLKCHCGNTWETCTYSNFVCNHRGCPECSGQNQKIAYISLISDGDIPIGLKYGIEKVIGSRIYVQNKKSIYDISRIKSFEFQNSDGCKNAEAECKKLFSKDNKKKLGRLGIITRNEMPDGHTETTYIKNIDVIIEIYKKYGGVEVGNSAI